MIYLRMMELLNAEAGLLTKRVIKDLAERGETEFHRKFPPETMYKQVYDVYSTLGYWLDRARPKEEIQQRFTDLGKGRFKEGIPLQEVVMSLMLIKRHLWLYLLEKHFFETPYELLKSLEMNNRIVLFFDRAILAAITGYEEMRAGSK